MIGSDKSMKGSKVFDVQPHLLHVNVLFIWPTNISTNTKIRWNMGWHGLFVTLRFYPRDAMLAQVLTMVLRLSVTSRCSIETAEWSRLVFGTGASYDILHCGTFKNKGTSLWNFAPNSGLHKKFIHSILIVEACYQHSSRKMDAQSVINWAVVGQLSWQYLRAPMLEL